MDARFWLSAIALSAMFSLFLLSPFLTRRLSGRKREAFSLLILPAQLFLILAVAYVILHQLPFFSHLFYCSLSTLFLWILLRLKSPLFAQKEAKEVGSFERERVLRILFTSAAVALSLLFLLYLIGVNPIALAAGFLLPFLMFKETVYHGFCGLLLRISSPFERGEDLVFEEIEGTLEKIGLIYTTLRTEEKTLFFVPNGRLMKKGVEVTSRRTHRKLELTMELSYEDDICVEKMVEKIRTLLLSDSSIDKHLPPLIYIDALREGAIDVSIEAYLLLTNKRQFLAKRDFFLLELHTLVSSDEFASRENPLLRLLDKAKKVSSVG
jgi:small-conductance mechanosensitive channel